MPVPSNFAHTAKLVLSVVGVVLGAILAVVAPAYVAPVAAVVAAAGGLFGVKELDAHQKSWAAYKSGQS